MYTSSVPRGAGFCPVTHFVGAEDMGIKEVYGDANKAESTLADMEAFGASL